MLALAIVALCASCKFPDHNPGYDPNKLPKEMIEFTHVMTQGPLKGKTVVCLGFNTTALNASCDYDHAY